MMHIDYVAPDRPHAEVQKASERVAQMQALVKQLKQLAATKLPDAYLLTRADREELKKTHPQPLIANVAFFTEVVTEKQGEDIVTRPERMVGFSAGAFDSNLYASLAIKAALIDSHRGRCAYCETLIHDTAYGDVEHFRPKAAFATSWSNGLFRPGYYEFAYSPENLLYSCQICNQSYKRNTFDVIGKRYPAVTLSQEVSDLVYPYQDEPRDFIRFNPLSAKAYPYDLTLAFYANQGQGPNQVQQMIWTDPRAIPGQTDFRGRSLSDPKVDAAFQQWLPSVSNAYLRRGTRTISQLGLNRAELVRARANQLRQVRAMLQTGANPGVDQQAAQTLLNALLQPSSTPQVTLVSQYISACIDATQTWNIGDSIDGWKWLDSYNQLIAAFVPKPQVIPPFEGNDSLCYLVLEAERQLSGRRRLVYISSSDRVYGNLTGQKGVTLSVDWKAELDNAVVISKNGELVDKCTLRELVQQLDGNNAAYALFRHRELWVLGDFTPLGS